jgi:hypothetical protein
MNDANALARAGLEPLVLDAVGGVARADVDAPDLAPTLPTDHPAWQRDVLSISTRARAVIAALRPIVIRVLSFWDHRSHELRLGSVTLGVDASGSYRLRSSTR